MEYLRSRRARGRGPLLLASSFTNRHRVHRRHFLRSFGSALLAPLPGSLAAADETSPNSDSSTAVRGTPQLGSAPFASPPPLAPIRASVDRIIAVNVCTRPFRAQGPRIEAERMGNKTIVHNYGHGGAGWSLSWGSAALALELMQAVAAKEIAVIGCGAIGLTTAITAQRAGLQVRIYAKDRPPDVRSSFASGGWSPDERICAAEYATPEFERRWETMARKSFRIYQTLLGLPGTPVEWQDGYVLSDIPFDQIKDTARSGEPAYPELARRLLRDLGPRSRALAQHEHPFPVAHARRYTILRYNIGTLSRLLLEDFLRYGGRIEMRTFKSLREFARLPEKVIVNATGYGARALLNDDSVVPVRGQTARLVPQPEVTYGLYHMQKELFVMPRSDGILVQVHSPGDFGNPDENPRRADSEAAVNELAGLFATPTFTRVERGR
jgi:glycine/D-amino acid oxidase-like deaminating enzyme